MSEDKPVQPSDIDNYFVSKKEFDSMGWTGHYVLSSKDILDFIIDLNFNKSDIDLGENEYVDLTKANLSEEVKQDFINQVAGNCCKDLLKTFLSFGLKTHIEQMITNDVNGKNYVLSFQTEEMFLKRFQNQKQ